MVVEENTVGGCAGREAAALRGGAGAALAGAAAAYDAALKEHYAATTAAQALLLVALGDVCAQMIEMNAGVSSSSMESVAGTDQDQDLAAQDIRM